jgi:hypothetical protein
MSARSNNVLYKRLIKLESMYADIADFVNIETLLKYSYI